MATKHLTEEQINAVVEKYSRGATIDELSKEFNRHVQSIRDLLRKRGLLHLEEHKQSLKESEAMKFGGEKTKILKGIPVVYEGKQYYDITHFPIWGIETPGKKSEA